MKKVLIPILSRRIGKKRVTRALEIHWQKTAIPMASPRTRSGKISAIMSQKTMLQNICMNHRKQSMSARMR